MLGMRGAYRLFSAGARVRAGKPCDHAQPHQP